MDMGIGIRRSGARSEFRMGRADVGASLAQIRTNGSESLFGPDPDELVWTDAIADERPNGDARLARGVQLWYHYTMQCRGGSGRASAWWLCSVVEARDAHLHAGISGPRYNKIR